jgi:ribosomal protein S18 acetylase RimI-like enzyme
MEYTIRQAMQQDAARIAQINVETWHFAYKGIISDEYLNTLSIEKRTADWYRILDPSNTRTYTIIIQDQNDIVQGYCSGGLSRINGFQAEIYALYLDPASHKKGLGRALIEAFMHYCREQDLTSICVLVLSNNPACGFYQAMGARFIRHESLQLGDTEYQESLYAW